VFIDGNPEGQVNPAGTFAKNDVNPGNHTIRLEHNQYAPYERSMHFAEGQVVPLSVHQEELGLVILNTAPNPISMTYHRAGEPQGQEHPVHPGAVWLPVGSYTFTAYWSNTNTCSKPAVVTPDGQVALNFNLNCN
jgi:hypothetical protein